MPIQLLNPHDCLFIQSRATVNFAIVDEYAALMSEGTSFEPCKGVIDVEQQIYIFDGYHRGEAAKKTGKFIEVELAPGTKAMAEWAALNANITHGLRRTSDDIARVVTAALKHAQGVSLSNRELARHCGCDEKTIRKYRSHLETSAEIPQIETRTVKRGDQEYQMNIPDTEKYATPKTRKCSGCRQTFADADLTARNGMLLCADCMQKVMRPVEKDALPIGRWRVMPTDVEVGAGNELFAHSNYGKLFISEATTEEKKQLIEALKIDKEIEAQNDVEKLVFDMTFDVDDQDVCERLCKTYLPAQIVGHPPFLDTVPTEKGWCRECRFAQSGHYLNAHGRKWCTLSIFNNLQLREELQVEKIKVYDDTAIDQECSIEIESCPKCGAGVHLIAGDKVQCYKDAKHEWPTTERFFAELAEQKAIEAQNPENYEDEQTDAEPDKLKAYMCDYCHNHFAESDIFVSSHPHSEIYGCICKQCTIKAIEFFNEVDFKFFQEDRNKLMQSGLRLFRTSWRERQIKEYSLIAKNTKGEGSYTGGSWKKFETFATKKDMQERIKTLMQDPKCIFESHDNGNDQVD